MSDATTIGLRRNILQHDCNARMYIHSGNSGREHRVDVREDRCTCRDHEHRDATCYHIRRARYALGVEPADRDVLAACDVHERFAEHAPGSVVVTSDGGVVGTALKSTERVDPRVREYVEQHGPHDYAGVQYIPTE